MTFLSVQNRIVMVSNIDFSCRMQLRSQKSYLKKSLDSLIRTLPGILFVSELNASLNMVWNTRKCRKFLWLEVWPPPGSRSGVISDHTVACCLFMCTFVQSNRFSNQHKLSWLLIPVTVRRNTNTESHPQDVNTHAEILSLGCIPRYSSVLYCILTVLASRWQQKI